MLQAAMKLSELQTPYTYNGTSENFSESHVRTKERYSSVKSIKEWIIQFNRRLNIISY